MTDHTEPSPRPSLNLDNLTEAQREEVMGGDTFARMAAPLPREPFVAQPCAITSCDQVTKSRGWIWCPDHAANARENGHPELERIPSWSIRRTDA